MSHLHLPFVHCFFLFHSFHFISLVRLFICWTVFFSISFPYFPFFFVFVVVVIIIIVLNNSQDEHTQFPCESYFLLLVDVKIYSHICTQTTINGTHFYWKSLTPMLTLYQTLEYQIVNCNVPYRSTSFYGCFFFSLSLLKSM